MQTGAVGELQVVRAAGPDVEAIIDSSSEAMLRLDASGAVTVWNRAAQRLLGRGERAMPGTVLAGCLAEEDRPGWAAAFKRALAGERSEAMRLTVIHATGRGVPASVTVSPAPGREGPADGAWCVARDLTEQVLAQRTLADSAERVRRSEALAGSGSFVVDRGVAAVQWSPGMYVLFGVTPLDFEPSIDAHLGLVHPDDRAAVEAVLREALTGRDRAELDHRVVRADGTAGWVFLAIEPTRDPGGTVLGASGVCQDVTQRKEAEAAIRAALDRERAAIEELRRLDSVKEGILATVSHELRTPLTSLLGFSALLREVCTEHEDLLAPIERNGHEMHQMVERLLDYSRLEAGSVAIDPRPVRLAEEVRACVRQLDSALGGRLVAVDVPDDLVVFADPDALERILVNLVGNAAKYTEAPARIAVAAERWPDGTVVVSVADSGPGIGPEHHASVFDRFFRVPGRTRAQRGTGVGLAIVRQYVELHGGRIWVESEHGRGATFRFDLPSPGATDD